MSWIQRAAVALVAAPLLAGAAAAFYVLRTFPALDGRLTTPGLAAAVDVRRDPADVTHIAARSPQDAWLALGYVHAQERSWQLAFNRRVMHGRLSELFGPATLETDKLMRTLDIRGAAQRQYAGLPAWAREALQAYSRGIQRFHHDRPQALPPEFLLTGATADDTTWTPEDSVGWALMMALDLGGNWGNEFARLSLARTLDTERLWQLMPPYPGEPRATAVDLHALYERLGAYRHSASAAAAHAPGVDRSADTALAAWSRDTSASAGMPLDKGSNNWVIGGARTASGKPLLANDPHLGLSAPALWYFARLQAPAGTASNGTPIAPLDVIGATLPGLPFVVLGRTARVAWGFTNTAPDVQDLYLEQIDPADATRYRTPDGWARFTTRSETIRVKGQPDVALTVRGTRHGPVLSDAQAVHGEVLDLSRYVLALRWSALDADNQTVLAGLLCNQAQSVDALFDAFAHYHSPMQSVVAADGDGAIRFQAVGRVPVRRADNDLRGVAPAPGWEARYDWAGWLAAADAPRDDGAQGWIATANQRVTPAGYAHFLTADWALPYRYDRIAERLAATPRHTVQSMQALQADTVSRATQRLLPFLQQTASSHPLAAAAQAELRGFDGDMRADRAAPLVFAVWADELARGLIAPRTGAARFAATYGRRDYRAALEGILERNDAWWCGDAGCAAASTAALDRALDRLRADHGSDPARWRWGTAHAAVSAHRPLGNVPLLARWFDVRVPSAGDAYTVNVGQYNAGDARGPFESRHAPSLRAVYDLADLERSAFIYQTGQSGLVFSPRYRDMRDAWAEGGYRPLQLAPARFAHHLVLTP